MDRYIALFRGINVGGKNIVPMKELASLMNDCGYENTQTYIQSGNVVFNSNKRPSTEIRELVEEKFGFKPEVLIVSRKELHQAIANNPYDVVDGKQCHFYFCMSTPKSANTVKLNQLKAASEEYAIEGKVFYLYAPDGIGRSKLAAGVEGCLGVSATARNLNTVNKLSEMVENAE
ncbi:MAG: DUF1697 domain-containing protein [Arenicella sp.]|nr:DUF1697 domain-containing protein [Arenicella sp.]